MKKSAFSVAAVIALGASALVAPAAWAAPIALPEGSGATVNSSTITVGTANTDVVFNSTGDTAYIPDAVGDTVAIVDVASGDVASASLVGITANSSIAISPDDTTLYVTLPADNHVGVLDLSDTATPIYFELAGAPRGVAFSPTEDIAYVTQDLLGSVAVLDTTVPSAPSITTTTVVGINASKVEFSPDGSEAYVASYDEARGKNVIAVIDAGINEVSTTIDLLSRANGIAFNFDSTKAYISTQGQGVTLIDVPSRTVTEVTTAKHSANSVAVSPDGSTVLSTAGSYVMATDARTNEESYSFGLDADAIVASAFNAAGTLAYLVHAGSVTVMDFDPALALPGPDDSAVSASVTSGPLTASLASVEFAAVAFSHGAQTTTADAVLLADDQTGLLAGWDVTMQASDLEWTSPIDPTKTGHTIAASELSLDGVVGVVTDSGDEFVGTTTDLVSLGSAVSVVAASDGDGNGSYSVPLTFNLAVPANAPAGSYVGTLTTTISSAP
jgi:DNA-binding beta-propeller fold protein YncE